MFASEPEAREQATSRQGRPSHAGSGAASRGGRRELALLFALFIALRAMGMWWFRPLYTEAGGFYFPFAYLQRSGYYPFLDYWLEYPPILAYVLVGLRGLCLAVCGTGPVGWERECLVRAVQLGSLVCETASLALVYVLARRLRGPRAAVRACWVYLALFATGFVASAYLDSLPVLLMLIGLLLITVSRPVWAAIALAAGLMTKFLPAALLPVALKAKRQWAWRALTLGAFVLFALYFAAPFLATGTTWLRCSAQSSLRRPPWQTVWALLDRRGEVGYVGPGRKAHSPAFFDRYEVEPGIRQLLLNVPPQAYTPASTPHHVAPDPVAGNRRLLADRGPAGERHRIVFYRVASRFARNLDFIESETKEPWVYPAAAFVVALAYLLTFATLPAELTPRRRLAFGAVTMFGLFFISKGWSPQFVAYLIPLLLIVFGPLEGGLYALLFSITAFLEMPVWASYVHPAACAPGASPTLAWLDQCLFHGSIYARTALLLLVIARLYPRLYSRQRATSRERDASLV